MLMIFKEIISNVKYKPCKSLRNAALLPNTINKIEELYICFCILWREDDNDYFTTHTNVIMMISNIYKISCHFKTQNNSVVS